MKRIKTTKYLFPIFLLYTTISYASEQKKSNEKSLSSSSSLLNLTKTFPSLFHTKPSTLDQNYNLNVNLNPIKIKSIKNDTDYDLFYFIVNPDGTCAHDGIMSIEGESLDEGLNITLNKINGNFQALRFHIGGASPRIQSINKDKLAPEGTSSYIPTGNNESVNLCISMPEKISLYIESIRKNAKELKNSDLYLKFSTKE